MKLTNQQDWWDHLINIAAELYPRGPADSDIWSRAGGSVAELHLHPSGKASWYSALRSLRLGGGGQAISLQRLLETMGSDFPANQILINLARTAPHILLQSTRSIQATSSMDILPTERQDTNKNNMERPHQALGYCSPRQYQQPRLLAA